jgi:hypothetical protein
MRAATDPRRARALVLAAVGAVSAGALGACASSSGTSSSPPSGSAGALPQGSEQVDLDPADFTVDITNSYWPMAVGDRWVYDESDGQGGVQRVEVTVLDQTRTVAAGIEARVVHDLVTATDGDVVEDTLDFYAQDSAGNVWYVGEETAEYENGQVTSREGSWEAGVDGAQPGIAVPAHPNPGLTYRQEYLKGQAEDEGAVLSTDEQVGVPTGMYTGAMLTRDTTALEPDLVELKFYAPGIGPVLTLESSGGAGREELIETNRTG